MQHQSCLEFRVGIYFVSSLSEKSWWLLLKQLFIYLENGFDVGRDNFHAQIPSSCNCTLQRDLEASVKAQTYQEWIGKSYTGELVICRSGRDG